MKRNYRDQPGCHNCRHCEKTNDYDESTSCWCNQDGSKRPISGSVLMDEPIHHLPDAEAHIAYEAWDKWCKGRECRPWCICDDYQEAAP